MNRLKIFFRQQWALYFLAVIALLVTLELTLRTHESAVASLQDGVLLKMEMFLTRGQTEVLFLGTSRTQDGIDPTLFAEKLGEASPAWKGARGFNGAAAGGSLDRLAYCVNRAVAKPGLKLLGLELGGAQLSNHHNWSPSHKAENPPSNLEEQLQQMLADHSYAVRYRKSFRLEIALKYPFVIFPDMSDGAEGFGQVGRFGKNAAQSQGGQQTLTFERIASRAIGGPVTLLPEAAEFIAHYRAMTDQARAHGVQLFLYVTPVRGEAAHVECNDSYFQTYWAIAQAAQVPLLQYACKDFPAEMFSDDGHMKPTGKRLWTEQLARDMALIVESEAGKHAL